MPVVTQDATGLTAAGYVGEDVDNCLLRLLDAADGDVKKAERGIVYIDEIDKLARYADNQRDVGGEGVQQALLKMVEGDLVTVNKDKNSRDRRSEATIDTSSILFIVGGAFVGLDKLVARRTKKAWRASARRWSRDARYASIEFVCAPARACARTSWR